MRPAPQRLLLPDDLLYRKLDPAPDFWDPTTLDVHPAAFADVGKAHTRLSLFVGKVKSPAAVLDFWASFGWAKRLCGNANAQGQDLYALGYGVAVVTVAQI